ncbi:craniofacial development protein 2-like [Antedon mediterranea]|uniref:craniofacial development protein 2-like n=1 Tax=Antedon mediterranea TaxID=105859 RepID=UPI003AF934F0
MCLGRCRKSLNTGSLNVRSIRSDFQKRELASDAAKYKLDILGVQSHHLAGSDVIQIRPDDNKGRYDFFYTGPANNTRHGVGILVESSFKAEFKEISERVITARINIEKHSEQQPWDRDRFYDEVQEALNEAKNRDILILAGDMNAKTGDSHHDYPQCVGRYGKGKTNNNGTQLVECALRNNLVLTNTMFKHKMSHRTTWECPQRRDQHNDQKSGEIRRNPYRNQIDYILVKNSHMKLVTNARAYSGTRTYPDHRLVKTTLTLQWYKLNSNAKKTKQIDVSKLQAQQNRQTYQREVSRCIQSLNIQDLEPQEKWTKLTTVFQNVALEVVGYIVESVMSEYGKP